MMFVSIGKKTNFDRLLKFSITDQSVSIAHTDETYSAPSLKK